MTSVKDNVIAVPIKGLTPDSNVNAQSTAVGYLVLVKKGQGNETEMFRKYDEIVHDSLVDTLLTDLSIDPKGEIPGQDGIQDGRRRSSADGNKRSCKS